LQQDKSIKNGRSELKDFKTFLDLS